MAKGAAWTILVKVAERGIGIVSMLILARLLIPEDFGLVAIATVVWGLLDALGEFNFEIPLIREKDPERRHYNTVWTLSIIKGVATGIILAAIAVPAAAFYGEPRLEGILYALAPAAVLRSLENVGVIDFRRELQFHKEFVLVATRRVLVAGVVLPLAFLWQDYWALVWGIVADSGIRVVLSFVMHRYRPWLSLGVAREYFHFSKWLLVSSLLGFFTKNSDRMILGKLLDAASLGIYRMAFELSTMTSSELISPIQRALFPGFTKLAQQKQKLRDHYLQAVQAIGALSIPMPLGIWVTADLLVPVVLGDRWLATIPLIKVFGFYGLVKAMMAAGHPALMAIGRVKLQASFNLTDLVLVLPGLYFGAEMGGLEGAVIGVTATTGLATAINLTRLMLVLEVSWLQFLRTLWRSLAASACMVGIVHGAKMVWPETSGLGELSLELFTLIALGAFSYVVIHVALWRLSGSPESAEQHALVAGRQVLQRARALLPRLSPRGT
jgi:PST family polysaccharide transporter